MIYKQAFLIKQPFFLCLNIIKDNFFFIIVILQPFLLEMNDLKLKMVSFIIFAEFEMLYDNIFNLVFQGRLDDQQLAFQLFVIFASMHLFSKSTKKINYERLFTIPLKYKNRYEVNPLVVY